MTGTAKTQLTEFQSVYNLDVVEVPTNREMIRADEQDLIYKTEDAKWNAVVEDLVERNEKGQPVLVGTVSIEKSEKLSGYLNRRGVPHHVLNAKNHEKEAMIVAQAGRIGAVTVATNMAGRGVDILLGGNPEYLARQEMAAREFDNDRYLLFEMDDGGAGRVRGRVRADLPQVQAADRRGARGGRRVSAGCTSSAPSATSRAGSTTSSAAVPDVRATPATSLFYLSLEDDLMRMFASERIGSIMERLKWPEDEPITAKMVTKAVESAQRQIEELNFERRKNVLKYDDVMNTQRQVIYAERQKILKGEDFKDEALSMVEDVVRGTVQRLAPAEVFNEEWDLDLHPGRARGGVPDADHPRRARGDGERGEISKSARSRKRSSATRRRSRRSAHRRCASSSAWSC